MKKAIALINEECQDIKEVLVRVRERRLFYTKKAEDVGKAIIAEIERLKEMESKITDELYAENKEDWERIILFLKEKQKLPQELPKEIEDNLGFNLDENVIYVHENRVHPKIKLGKLEGSVVQDLEKFFKSITDNDL